MRGGWTLSKRLGPALGVDVSDWKQVKSKAERGLRGKNLTPEREGTLRYRLGSACFALGDLLRAEQQFYRYLDLTPGRVTLEPMSAHVHEQMGQIHRLLKRPSREVDSFRRAAAAYEAAGQMVDALRCRLHAAQSLLWAGRAEAALPDLLMVLTGLSLVEAPELRLKAALAHGLYLGLTGSREAGRLLCMTLLDTPPLLPADRAEVAWLLGENALAMGDLTAAELHGAIAHHHALAVWSPPQLERIESLQRRIRRAAGGSR